MTHSSRFLVACTAAVLFLGLAAPGPAAADNMTAHQASKMLRRPVMHHRGRMVMHKRMMMHRMRATHRSM